MSDQQVERKLSRDRAWVLGMAHCCVSAARDAGLTLTVDSLRSSPSARRAA